MCGLVKLLPSCIAKTSETHSILLPPPRSVMPAVSWAPSQLALVHGFPVLCFGMPVMLNAANHPVSEGVSSVLW